MPVSWQRLAFMTGRLMCHISTYHPNNQIFVKWSILTIFSFQFSQVFSVGAILDVLFCCMSKKEPHFYKNVTGNEWFHMWKWQFYMWIWLFWKWKENEWSGFFSAYQLQCAILASFTFIRNLLLHSSIVHFHIFSNANGYFHVQTTTLTCGNNIMSHVNWTF